MDVKTGQPTARSHLPTELMRLILEELYLIAPTSIQTCRLVSRVWNELSTPILFRRVTLHAETTLGVHEALPDDIYFILQNDGTLGLPDNSPLETVKIVQRRNEDACKRRKNRAISLLEHLLGPSGGNTSAPEQRAPLVRELIVLNDRPPPLRRNGPFTEQDVANETNEVLRAILNGLQSMPALRVLRWNSFDAPSSEIIDTLACKSLFLKEVHLSRLLLSDTAAASSDRKLAPALPEPAHFFHILSKLRSFRCTIFGNNRPLLYHILENCDTLEELGIIYSDINLADMCALPGRPWKSRLKALELTNMSFTVSTSYEPATLFCNSLGLSRFESVRLENCIRTFAFLQVLTANVGFQTIKHLSILFPGGGIGVASIVSFLRTLGLLGSLESLELAGLGFKIDINAIIENEQLKVLRIAEWDVRAIPHHHIDGLGSPEEGRLWIPGDILALGTRCTALSELWIDVAHGTKLDVGLVSSLGSLNALRKIGLCFQPQWKPIELAMFLDEISCNQAYEKPFEIEQQTVLEIAQLIYAGGSRSLREIEIQRGCRRKPTERSYNHMWFIGDGGARETWEVKKISGVLEVYLVKKDRLVNKYGVPVWYEFDGW